jgi:hypothetical protein
MKDISVFPALIVGCVAFSAAPAFGQTRNPTTWPFSGTSPWNTPIGSGATFAPISASVWNKLNSNGTAYYQLALNWQANTTSVIIAGTKDPTWTIYDNQNLTFPPSGGETLIPLSTEYNNSVWYSLHAPTAPDASGAQTWCEPVTDDDTSTFISDSISPTAASLQANGGLYYNCTGCLQIGALLVIPPSINLNNYTWTTYGRIVAQAAQTYGIYITDTGSPGEMNLLAELNDPDLNGANGSNLLPGANGWSDLQQIRSLLVQVTNNTPSTVGGGGNPPANWSPPPPFAY